MDEKRRTHLQVWRGGGGRGERHSDCFRERERRLQKPICGGRIKDAETVLRPFSI